MSDIGTYVRGGVIIDPYSQMYYGTPYGGDYGIGWRDLVGNPTVRGVGAADPDWKAITGLTGMWGYSFSASTMQQIWFTFHLDHDYAPGTPIYLHVHWLNAAAVPNTGNVRWGLQYTYARGHQQQAFPAATTVYVTQAAQSTRYMHMIAEVADADVVPSTNLQTDGLLLVRAFRDAANAGDTCTDEVFMLTMDCHYQSDRHATRNKAPDFNAY